MFKTITTVPNWTTNQGNTQQFLSGLQTFINDGKYTAQVTNNYDPETDTRVIERWDWVDEAATQEFIALVDQVHNLATSGITVQVIDLSQ